MVSRRRTLSRETVSDMRCRTPDAPAPGRANARGPPNTGAGLQRLNSTHETQRLRRSSRLGPSLGPSPERSATRDAGGRTALISAPTTSRNKSHELACDAGLTAGSASAGPPRGGRAARRYARTFSPGRSAATIAARGQGLLWGTTATQTRHETGEQTPPGTQPNAYSQTRTQRNALGRNATWTQRDAETRTQTRCKDADTNQRETTQ